MSLATLSFEIDGDASGFSKAAESVDKDMQKMRKGLMAVRNVAAGVAAVLTGVLVKGIQEASKESAAYKAATDGLSKSTHEAFMAIGDVLLPAVIAATNAIKDLVDKFNELSPAQKQMITYALAGGAALATVTASVAQLAIMLPKLKQGFMVFRAVLPLIGGALIPLVAIAAAVAGLILIVGAVKQAWDANLGGVRDITASVFQAIKGFFEQIPGWVSEAASFWVKSFFNMAKKAREILVAILPESIAAALPKIPEPTVIIEAVKFAFKDAEAQAVKMGGDMVSDIVKTFKIGLNVAKEFGASLLESGKHLLGFDGAADEATAAEKEKAAVVVDATRSVGKLADAADEAAEDWAQFSPSNLPSPPPMVAVDAEWLAFQQNMNDFSAGLGAGAAQLAAAIPRLGELVSAAQQGAEVGGVWGALIAVFVQLLSETEAFNTIIEIVNGDLDQLIAGLEPLVEAIAGLMEAFDPLSNIITTLVTVALKPIGIILNIVTMVLKKLAPLFKAIGEALDKFANWLDDLIERITNFFNGKGFSTNDYLESQKQKGVTVKGEGLISDVDRYGNSLEKGADGLDTFTKAAIAAREALTNVPQGYKVTAARFAAMAAEMTGGAFGSIAGDVSGLPHFATGGIVTKPTLAMIGEAGPEAIVPLGAGGAGGFTINGNVTIVANDPDEFFRKLRRRAFTGKGASFG